MARPKKNNADYFSHDSDMRNDAKIKAVRRKFGIVGYGIYNMLIEHLTDCDFFEYEYTELNIELLSGDFDIETSELIAIIDYCKLLKLFTVKDGKLYSESLKKRLNTIKKSKNQLEHHPNWKGGITSKNKSIRDSKEYKIWRTTVFKRDNYKCRNCGSRGTLNAHHIKSFSGYPKLRTNVDNGLTLCIPCHKKAHNNGK